MKCLDDCHTYEMDYVMEPTEQEQAEAVVNSFSGEGIPTSITLRFYEMREDGTKINGVTNEEVLRVLIHRLEFLNKKMPCFENTMALSSLKGALSWLNARTEERTKRGVEGTHKP
jgi:hypothetical protein